MELENCSTFRQWKQVVEVSYLFRVPANVRPFSLARALFRLVKRCVHKNSYGIIGVTRMVVVTAIPVAVPGRNRHKFNVRTVLQCTLNHPRSHLKRALSYCSGRAQHACEYWCIPFIHFQRAMRNPTEREREEGEQEG